VYTLTVQVERQQRKGLEMPSERRKGYIARPGPSCLNMVRVTPTVLAALHTEANVQYRAYQAGMEGVLQCPDGPPALWRVIEQLLAFKADHRERSK